MKWVVEYRDNLTVYDTYRGDDPGREDECHPTNELINTYTFDTEAEAIEFFNQRKAMLRFAGSAGAYYTYPRKSENGR